MRFIFDCEDEILLPATYHLVEEIKPFIDKMKRVEVDEKDFVADKKTVFKKILENMMVKYPADTSKVLSRLWVLEEVETPILDKNGVPVLNDFGEPITFKQMEKAPNALKTMAVLFSSEAATDFFSYALPSLLSILKMASPLLNSKK